jgi:hypothetical protein
MDLRLFLQIITTLLIASMFIYYVYIENRIVYYKYMYDKCQQEKLDILKNCGNLLQVSTP